MCSGQKNPSWATWGKQASRRMTSTPKSQLCQRNRELDHEFHVNNVQGTEKSKLTWRKQVSEATDRKIQSERCEQNNSHRDVVETRKIYIRQKMCPAAKRKCVGQKAISKWTLVAIKQRLPHTLWNHRTSSFTNKQMMDSASIYRQRNQQRHKKTTHPKQGGKLKQVLP